MKCIFNSQEVLDRHQSNRVRCAFNSLQILDKNQMHVSSLSNCFILFVLGKRNEATAGCSYEAPGRWSSTPCNCAPYPPPRWAWYFVKRYNLSPRYCNISIGEYWNIPGVPVLPENVMLKFLRQCFCYRDAYKII